MPPEEELGLFPLATALLPDEDLPLHIFEPRYKELIGGCLALGTAFGFIYRRGRVLGPIGTRAGISQVLRRYDDGRLDIVVTGQDRFRLLKLTGGRSFVTGLVMEVTDDPEPPAAGELEACRRAFRRVALTDPPGAGDAFALGARLELPAELKQELLEATSERARLRALTAALDGDTGDELRERQVGRRAATNGKTERG
jgi:ATP-dependent Lon protease